MRSGLVIAVMAVVATACKYTHGALGDDLAIDAGPVDTRPIDAQPIDAVADAYVAPYCDPTDSTIVVCYQFEGNTNDGSANQLHASMTNLAFVAGRDGMAMEFNATSAADVGDSTLFDVAALTFEAWVKPSQMPTTGNRMGILDMNGQYGFFIHPTGNLGCTIVGGVSMNVPANITTTAWTHVACTYDGATTNIYSNGLLVATGSGGGTLATGGTTGISLAADNPPGAGSRLIGLVDEVRLSSVARTGPQICAAAGACP